MGRKGIIHFLIAVGVVTAAWPATATAPDSSATALRPAWRTMSPAELDAFALGRGVNMWLANDLRGAVTALQTIDISKTSPFEQADRAAFLLAMGHLELGELSAFYSVLSRAADENGSMWRQWLAWCRFSEGDDSLHVGNAVDWAPRARALPLADLLAASLLIERGRPADASALLLARKPSDTTAALHAYLLAAATERAGAPARTRWNTLASLPSRNPFDADMVGLGVMRTVEIGLEQDENVVPLLERMPDASVHAPRALHLRALLALDRGDTTAAIETLDRILREYGGYDRRRDVTLVRGGLLMDQGRWSDAMLLFESTEFEWQKESEMLDALHDAAGADGAWHTWESDYRHASRVTLLESAVRDAMDSMAAASLNLARQPQAPDAGKLVFGMWPAAADIDEFSDTGSSHLWRHHPTDDEFADVSAAQRHLTGLEAEVRRHEYDAEQYGHELNRRLRYFRHGSELAGESADTLGGAIKRLDVMLAHLDATLNQLAALRDTATVRVVRRTRAMHIELERTRLFMSALRHFHVNGPTDEPMPADSTPRARDLLEREATLALETQALLTLFATHYPTVIARSHAEIWEPNLAGNSYRLRNELALERRRASRTRVGIDSTLAWYSNDDRVGRLLAQRDAAALALDVARAAERQLRATIAMNVAERGREELAGERESIDYHLADAAWEAAVELATQTTTAENPVLVRPARDRAIARLNLFLHRYPESPARGESRFRLADMELLRARDAFEERMASFLGDTPTAEEMGNRALAPFVDYSQAERLYRDILTEDPAFPHTDAVLFNLGMILSDDGDPGATEMLTRLVTGHPASPHCQEAHLRLGSDAFDRKDYDGSVASFEAAAAGADPSFGAIALYKLGWAHFDRDRFDPAVDAFRRLMDLYAANARIAKTTDLRDEAQEYLVHALSRSGGADAFARYFDRIGPRDYESQILVALGYLLRSVSLYPEAIACDDLWLDRYADDAMALDVTERLVGTYARWNKTEDGRAARLRLAGRFTPQSRWMQLHADSTALIARATTFARGAFHDNAAHYHREARKTNDTEQWSAALDGYEAYLLHWPADGHAPRVHYAAGEAAAQLQQYARSISHFTVAASSDTAAFAIDASWQRVAVNDTWYRTTVVNERGADSLAVRTIQAGWDFTTEHPQDDRVDDVIWRQGNVAYAHGWYGDAAAYLGDFGTRFSGDDRALRAIRLGGDARYHLRDFAAAGDAYRQARDMAIRTGEDSVVVSLNHTIPLCYYQHGEAIVAADSTHGPRRAAPIFAGVARDWPAFTHADLALYRAGLGFLADGETQDATIAWESILQHYPDSEYARDASAQIAGAWEASGDPTRAATAWERFSRQHPDDPDAPDALLKAADLLAEAGDTAGAEALQSQFVSRYPGETETVMAIRAARAERALSNALAGTPSISALLGPAQDGGASELSAYLTLAEAHPELASRDILVRVDFLKAEEMLPAYAAQNLTQPLPRSIERKKASMEKLLKQYDRCASHGVAEYARASAYRIGEALIAFGDALVASERPGELEGDDLVSYEEVIEEQSWGFYDRGENAWTELLQQTRDLPGDPGGWVERTRSALWPRLAMRFYYKPEIEHPVLAGTPPGKDTASGAN